MRIKILIIIAICSPFSVSKGKADLFKDNDTVVLLGNTVMERAQKYGHFETSLTLVSGKKNLKFRNLAWSGDSVFGHARSYFGPPKEGFSRLTADVRGLKPNVVIVCYGAVAAFEGKEGLAKFIKGYEKLLMMLSSVAKPREIILMSAPPAESMGAPMPDMAEHNRCLALYSEAISKLAAKNKFLFADFYSAVKSKKENLKNTFLTDNGLHFHEKGYRAVTSSFMAALGLKSPDHSILNSKKGKKLTQVIVAKNKLFFHQWRPANETYLRLFRRHEQGKNVKELPMFDPFIEQREKDIETLRNSILTK